MNPGDTAPPLLNAALPTIVLASSLSAAPLLDPAIRAAAAKAGVRTRRLVLVALVLSLFVHLVISIWPVELATAPESTPLMATITELPPPPTPVATAAAKPPPKPRRSSPINPPAPPVETIAEAVAPDTTADTTAAEAAAKEAQAKAAADAAVAAEAQVTPGAATGIKVLPPRVDLAYKVFYGTRGFLIGDAVYRFEHSNNRYRIATVGEARGLAALVLRGQGKIESRGLITDQGLQPLTFRVERGGPDRVETATFDWEAGLLTLFDNRTEPLDLPTFDPLALMWQYYFTPPTTDKVSFTVGTPRRIHRYTMTREATETIDWPQGKIAAERWHRQSEDGKTDAYVWLAPSLRHIPVKIRVSNTDRGTIEVVLDSIRVDETATGNSTDAMEMPRAATETATMPSTSPAAAALGDTQPGATFPTMTGQ
ncbi:MAG: DUF3108 domain-containing protein [Betaproteobacteria bacterium]